MPRFTLGYWRIRGLAAGARMLLFFIGERDFEDARYEQGDAPGFSRECWLSVKHALGLDFPNLPYLIDHEAGVRLTQSMAVLKYIARVGAARTPSLTQGNDKMAPYVDMLENQAMDLRNAMVRCFYGAKSEDEVKAFRDGALKGMLELLEAWFGKERGGPFALGAVSYVDFFLAEHLEQLEVLWPGTLAASPRLAAYLAAFLALPEVAEFRASKYFFAGPVNNKVAFVNN